MIGESVKDAIAAARKAGIPASVLADAAKLAPSTIWRLEEGRREPGISTALAVAAGLERYAKEVRSRADAAETIAANLRQHLHDIIEEGA